MILQYIQYIVANSAEILGTSRLMACLVLCHTKQVAQGRWVFQDFGQSLEQPDLNSLLSLLGAGNWTK